MSGDTDRWLTLYTDDQVKMPPGRPATFGKPALQAVINGQLEVFSFTEFEIITEEVQTAGDWAHARGNYTALFDMNESDDQIPIDGKFLTNFEQQSDGSWLLHRDIFNSNIP